MDLACNVFLDEDITDYLASVSSEILTLGLCKSAEYI
jgi:hypothetical protein